MGSYVCTYVHRHTKPVILHYVTKSDINIIICILYMANTVYI